jgi:pyruvate dehydrogenase (quinone)
LLPRLKWKENRSFLEKAQKGMEDWRKIMHDRATRRDVPMKPQVIAHQLGVRLREDAIVSDSGTIATWWARHIPVKKGQIHSLSGNLASMANGPPYTIAAQIAHPDWLGGWLGGEMVYVKGMAVEALEKPAKKVEKTSGRRVA